MHRCILFVCRVSRAEENNDPYSFYHKINRFHNVPVDLLRRKVSHDHLFQYQRGQDPESVNDTVNVDENSLSDTEKSQVAIKANNLHRRRIVVTKYGCIHKGVAQDQRHDPGTMRIYLCELLRQEATCRKTNLDLSLSSLEVSKNFLA